MKLEDLKEDELPDELKTLKPEERQAYLDNKSEERRQIQEKVQQLSKERDTYLAAERKKLAAKGDIRLDAAIVESVRKQAARMDFQFEK